VRLLVGDPDHLGQLLLGQPEHDPPLANAPAYVIVDGGGRPPSLWLCHAFTHFNLLKR
jgi:hypothetical protein